MKKLFAFAMALAICLAAFSVSSAFAATFTAEGVYTVTYDDAAYTVDTTTYADENVDDTYHWYGLIYNNDYAIDATVYDVENLAGVTLFTMEELERQEYVDYMMDAHSDSAIDYIGSLTVSEYNIPFYFFTAEDSEGEYLFAQTLVQGKAIDFAIYYNDASMDVDQTLVDALSELVNTFVPAI